MPDSAAELIPPKPTLAKLRDAAAGCRPCPLWENATQTVFGAGLARSVAMFGASSRAIARTARARRSSARPGESSTRPSTWPASTAGPLTSPTRSSTSSGSRAASAASTRSRAGASSQPAAPGSRRSSPQRDAAQSLLGRRFRVTKERGKWVESDLAEHVTATIHPSAILRQRDEESRRAEMEAFVKDLKLVASVL
jgi:uracil-DNA glycosylase